MTKIFLRHPAGAKVCRPIDTSAVFVDAEMHLQKHVNICRYLRAVATYICKRKGDCLNREVAV
jgi:hypothetical protein